MIDGRISVKQYHGLKRWTAALSGMLLLAAAMPAGTVASVLDGPNVLYRTAKAMGRYATLQVTQQLTVYPESPEAELSTFDETAIYVMPERFRSDIETDQLQRTHLEFGTTFMTVLDGKRVVERDRLDLYQRLLRNRTHAQLMRAVNQLGVETAISSLGRVGDTIVYVVGARYPDESVSQLAIDKETFLPLRLLLVDMEKAEPPMEIIYRDWRQMNKGWFPYHIVVTVDSQLSREIRVSGILPNPSIPAEKMDLEALQKYIAQSETETPQQQETETVIEEPQKVEGF